MNPLHLALKVFFIVFVSTSALLALIWRATKN